MKSETIHYTPAQRAVALLYGIVCHLSFALAISVMAVSLFTGMQLSRGPFRGPAAWAANLLLLASFPLIHSRLLTPRGRRFMARLVPLGIGPKLSWTVFATLASLQLLAVFVFWSPSPTVWWTAHGGLRIALACAAAGSWLLLAKSMADAQLGIQTGYIGWSSVFFNRKAVCKPFATQGLYRHVRQPIYISFALLLWLSAVWTPGRLLLAAGWTAYCIIGSAIKERRFVRCFGEAFRRYQQEVPFWIPAFRKRSPTAPESAKAQDADVIIIGAGPIGLLLAALLARRGLRIFIAEQRSRPPQESMAIGITPPSLQTLATLGLDRAFIEEGIPITRATVYENRRRVGGVDFSRLPSAHRCILSLPQSRTIALLRRHLLSCPNVTLLDGMRFTASEPAGNGIRIRLQDVESSAHSELTAAYLVGCDGHRSAVRNRAGIAFRGRYYRSLFFMADFADRTGWGDEARLYFGPAGSVEAFPLAGGRRRWIVQMPRAAKPETGSTAAMVARQAAQRTGIDLADCPAAFESSFRPQRRLAATYRRGRILLCGDAAHVMSPIGGQGMNTGFADALHLDRAIAEALEHPERADREFACYTRLRRQAFSAAAARAARGMWLGTRRGPLFSLLRRFIIGRILLRPTIRERLARCFAMLTIPGNENCTIRQEATAS